VSFLSASLEPRIVSATRAPQCANDHTRIVKRVVEMRVDSSKVNAADTPNSRLCVRRSCARKHGYDFESLFELVGEHVDVIAVGQPPRFLSSNLFVRSSCEMDDAMFQRDRSSRRMAPASTRRPLFTSSPDALSASWRAARSAASSQSPGSSGRSSISVPSGKSVGSSTTSRPAFTRPFSVMAPQ
jgi:hypothetical protein